MLVLRLPMANDNGLANPTQGDVNHDYFFYHRNSRYPYQSVAVRAGISQEMSKPTFSATLKIPSFLVVSVRLSWGNTNKRIIAKLGLFLEMIVDE